MIEVKKIDIHAHATIYPDILPPNKYTKQPFISGSELLEIYDKLNIEKGTLLPLISQEGQWGQITNESCKVLADQYPERFLWFCNVDPRAGDNSDKTDLGYLIHHYKSLGAKGLGELTSHLYADDPKMDNLFRYCEEADMPVMIHIAPKLGIGYGIVDEMGLPRIERILKKHPDLKLIGHSQPFWGEISSDLAEGERNGRPSGKVTEGRVAELMREYGNLYCDLSAGSGSNAMMRDPEYAARFMEEFSDRIMYGCDIGAVNNTHQYVFNDFLNQMVADGMISGENYVKIVRENAIKLLKLDV